MILVTIKASSIIISSYESSQKSNHSKKECRLINPVTNVLRVLPLATLSFSLCHFSPQWAYAGQGPANNAFGGGGGGGGNVGNISARNKKPVVITLAAYGVARFAYEKITALFTKYWLLKTGQKIRFRLSIGGSGSQARAVIDGLPAEIVSLALPLDVIQIEKAGLIRPGWRERAPNSAVPAETTVCIALRPKNPKNVNTWRDLARKDIQVIACNPKTAGVARWTFLALWGSVIVEEKKGEEDAIDFLEQIFRNVPVQPRDGREASDVFVKQKLGDALVTYENEIIVANQKIKETGGKELISMVVPPVNVVIETVISVVDVNAEKSGVRDICDEFVSFTFTEPAQKIYADAGFRPYLRQFENQVKRTPGEALWRAEEKFGSWTEIQKKFFDPKGVMDKIEHRIGSVQAT